MAKARRFFFIETGGDSRWAWGGTLKQPMEKVIAEMPWHFLAIAREGDVIFLPKSWPGDFPKPQEILGLPQPECVSTLKSLGDFENLNFVPFSWDETTIQWANLQLHPSKRSHSIQPQLHVTMPNLKEYRKINGRRFSLSLEQNFEPSLAGWNADQGCIVQTISEIRLAMEQRKWFDAMLKGEHGQAGNANVHLKMNDPKTWDLAQGILKRCGCGVLEAWHAIQTEYGFQYQLDSMGQLSDLNFHRMLTTRTGHFLGVVLSPSEDVPLAIQDGFRSAAAFVSQALHDKGYWGPVGQDGYSYTTNKNPNKAELYFRPLSDLNVRMTMASPAHELKAILQHTWGISNFHLAWLFLPGKYRLSGLSKQEREQALGDWAFDLQRKTGALWMTPSHDCEGRPVERHSLIVIETDMPRLEKAIQYFREWALTLA